jgi:hypothetical protein
MMAPGVGVARVGQRFHEPTPGMRVRTRIAGSLEGGGVMRGAGKASLCRAMAIAPHRQYTAALYTAML